jgi:hypothetical protein
MIKKIRNTKFYFGLDFPSMDQVGRGKTPKILEKVGQHIKQKAAERVLYHSILPSGCSLCYSRKKIAR